MATIIPWGKILKEAILIDRIGTFEFLFELQTATLWMVKENHFL